MRCVVNEFPILHMCHPDMHVLTNPTNYCERKKTITLTLKKSHIYHYTIHHTHMGMVTKLTRMPVVKGIGIHFVVCLSFSFNNFS